jgi:hypothetical protein
MVVGVALLFYGVGCGSTDGPSTTSTTTTSAASSTSTTTSVPGFTGSFTVQNLPCNATAVDPTTCTFVASATGGTGTYTFAWVFSTSSSSNSTVNVTGQSVRPVLGCGFSVGAATIPVTVTLTIMSGTATITVPPVIQQVVRVGGNCGV